MRPTTWRNALLLQNMFKKCVNCREKCVSCREKCVVNTNYKLWVRKPGRTHFFKRLFQKCVGYREKCVSLNILHYGLKNLEKCNFYPKNIKPGGTQLFSKRFFKCFSNCEKCVIINTKIYVIG